MTEDQIPDKIALDNLVIEPESNGSVNLVFRTYHKQVGKMVKLDFPETHPVYAQAQLVFYTIKGMIDQVNGNE